MIKYLAAAGSISHRAGYGTRPEKEKPMNPIRVLIADDHPLFRDGIHGLLDSIPTTEVVAEAGSGDEAVAMAQALAPDVILMDVKMPGTNGIEATRAILAANPRIAILM